MFFFCAAVVFHDACVHLVQVAMNILNSGRFSMGSACAGMIKKLIGALAGHMVGGDWEGCHVWTGDGV